MSVELWTPPTAVTVARHAFRTETVTLEMPHGATIDEIIVAAGLPPGVTLRVWIAEWEIAPEHWGTTRPRPGRKVLIRAVAGGGGGDSNKTLRTVLMVVVLIAALVVSIVIPVVGIPALGIAAGSTGALIAGGVASAAISIAGMYAVNALLPMPKPKLRDQTLTAATPTYAITGTQNQLAPYQAVPRVYGRHRLYPPLAAYPVTAGQGTTQTLSQLFTLGYGPLQIEDIRIGDTPIGLYEGVTLEVRHGWPPGVEGPLTTFPYDTFEEPLGIDLTPPEGSTSKTATRATAPADVIGIEVLFPRGLFRVEADNQTQGFSGVLTVVGVPASTGGAVRLLEQTITEQRVESLRFSYTFDVQAYGETAWTLHVTWAIPPGWEGPERPNPVVIYDLVWSALRLTNYVDPIPLPGMAKIGLTLLASGQLTGIVNQLNCIATSILLVWDIPTATWVQRETRNPAWIYRDILQESATARPVAWSQIDFAALLAWGADCDAKGYTFDAVFDAQTTVFEALSLVAAAGRASFSMRDGMYSVVRDVPQTVPVQQFTPRNSTGFSATKVFTDLPHALKVRFINPVANWQQDEVVVCDDGYSATPVGDGVELVANGGFTTDLSGWTETNTGAGNTTQIDGEARLTGAAHGQAFLSQAVPIAHGLQYRVSFTVTLASVAFRAGSSEGAEDLVADQVLLAGAFTATFYTPASAPGSPACWLRFFKGDYETAGIDNVSVWVIAVDGADPGEELVVNGQFTTDLSGWTATTTGAGQTIQVAGEARLTGAAYGQAFFSQAVPTVVGSRYVVAFTVAHAPVAFRAGSSEAAQDLVLDRVAYPGAFTASFTAVSSACWLRFSKSDTEATGIDNVSVEAITQPLPTKFEGLEVFGVTDAALAWRHGRYWLAAARLRPETYTLGVDIEHLVAQRGDLVHVQHDVPLWGYGSGRIVRTDGPLTGVTAFVLDELFDTLEVGTVVFVRIRLQDGTSVLRGAGVTPDPATRSTLFGLDSPAANIAVGDLVSIGEPGKETVPCLIARIEAGPDLSARLTLVDLAPGIHTADTGPIPPFESFVSRVPIRNRLPPWPPLYVAIGSDELAMMETAPGTWMISILVTAYAVPDPDQNRLVPTMLELQFRPVGSAAQWQQVPPQTVTAGGVAHFYAHPVQEGLTYDLRLRAIAMPESVASEWALAQHTVIGEATPPPAPVNLRLDYTSWESLQYLFVWDYPTPPRDFPGGFQVRIVYYYFPPTAVLTGEWTHGTPLHGGLLTLTHLLLPVLPLGLHTLMVKALDRAGHASIDASWLAAHVQPWPAPVDLRLHYAQAITLQWTGPTAWLPAFEGTWPITYPWAGFRVRIAYGVLGAYWETATPLVEEWIAQWSFTLPVLPLGVHTLMVKTVDWAGYDSAAPAWLFIEVLALLPPTNFQLDLDQVHLRWAYAGDWAGNSYPWETPVWRISYGAAGFRLRYVPGVTGAWDDGWPLHDGLISDTRFALPPLTTGTYTFLLKTVDAAGYESRDAAVLVTDLAGSTPQNIVAGIDYGAAGYPGVIEGLHYEDVPPPPRLCNDLIADGPHWTQDSARYWTQDPALYWGDIYGAGCYTITFVVPIEDAGTTLTLDWTGTGPWRVEYLTTGDSAFWAHHTPFFWETAATVFWSQSYGAWQPWPGSIIVNAQRYGVRWCTSGPEEACLTHVETVFDVADLITWIDDWPLPAAPSRLPMNQEFREILNVQITVVQSTGQPVRVVDVLDKSPLGPLVQARLADGTATTAQIDAVLKGY